jgi:hypothetical protein
MQRGAVCLIIVLSGAIRGQQFPPATEQHGAFALPDPSGVRLLANPALPHPESFHTALCSGARRFSVRFERRQTENKDNNGRRTSYNFDKLEGGVFAVLQGKIDVGAACFLASDALLSSATAITAEAPAKSAECGTDVRERLDALRSRNVVNCWPVAALPAGKRLVLAEFVRRDKDALASLVLMDGNRAVFADYQAVFRGEGQDLWRADDGGVLSAEGLDAVFLLQRGPAYTLGVNWRGTEGASLAVFVSKAGDRFTQAIADYWYEAPL